MEIRELLAAIDRQYENEPNLAQRIEASERRYSRLTFKDLYRPFTV